MPQIALSILVADFTRLSEQVLALGANSGVHKGDDLENAVLREIYALAG